MHVLWLLCLWWSEKLFPVMDQQIYAEKPISPTLVIAIALSSPPRAPLLHLAICVTFTSLEENVPWLFKNKKVECRNCSRPRSTLAPSHQHRGQGREGEGTLGQQCLPHEVQLENRRHCLFLPRAPRAPGSPPQQIETNAPSSSKPLISYPKWHRHKAFP